MVFSSLTFLLLFLPILLMIYFSIKSIKVKNIILLIFSLIFYAWGEPIYVILMIISIMITYISGIKIYKYKSETNKARIIFIIAVALLLSFLLFFKYCNFILSNLNLLFNLKIKEIKLSLPIGISFYTFQAISYIADIYLGKIKAQKKIINLALYICLFPQLIAGPIVRYETIEYEINKRKHNLKNIEIGLKRFIVGLSKKVIIANSMAIIADTIFSSEIINGTEVLWLGAISYTLQI